MNLDAIRHLRAAIQELEESTERRCQALLTRIHTLRVQPTGGADIEDDRRVEMARSLITRTLLPSAPLIFYGRESELTELVDTVIQKHPARVAVCGPPGIGKTTLVHALLRQREIASSFGPRRNFVPCNSAASLDSLALTLATHFGLSSHRAHSQTDLLVTKVVDHLSQVSEPSVLVLDGFDTPWEPLQSRTNVENFLTCLSDIPSLSIIITIRGAQRPYGPKWTIPCLLPMKPLDIEATRQTFMAISDQSPNDPHVGELIALSGNLPLAVVLLANMAQYESPTALLQRWEDERTSMLIRGPVSLDESIRLSLSDARITACPPSLVLLSILSVLPDGFCSQSADVFIEEIPDFLHSMSVLRQTSLVYTNGDGRFRILAPIRSYVTTSHPLQFKHLRILETYAFGLVELTKTLGQRKDADVMTRIVAEVGNIQAVIDCSLRRNFDPTLAIRAAIDLAYFQKNIALGNYSCLHRALAAAEQMNDMDLQADCLHAISSFSQNVVLPGSSSDSDLLRALRLYEETKNVSGQGRCLISLATNDMYRNALESSTARINRALLLFSGNGDMDGQARALVVFARLRRRTGNLREALMHGRRALKMYSSRADLVQQSVCYVHLGETALLCADYHTAMVMSETAVHAFQTLGLDVERHWYHTRAVACMAEVLLLRADFERARAQYAKILPIYRKQQRLDYEADCLVNLGRVSLALDDADGAKDYFDSAMDLWSQRLKNVWGEGCCVRGYGDLAVHAMNPDPAVKRYMYAMQLFRKCRQPQEEADCYVKLGDLDFASGNIGSALTRFIVALAIFRQIQGLSGQIRCMQRLGDVCFEGGDTLTATMLYEIALHGFKAMDVRREIADCLLRLGDISNLGDNRTIANERWRGAMELYQLMGDSTGITNCSDRLQ